jgi:tetratricopeptide (TPR) repeat protein
MKPLPLLERQSKLAPGAADTAELASHVLAASGYPNDAIELSEKAMTLSPNYPAVYLGTLGSAYRLSGRPEQAIAAFQAYHARNPGFGLTDIVIIYQQTDQPEKARRTAEQLLVAARISRLPHGARPSSVAVMWRKLKPIPWPFVPPGSRQVERAGESTE